MARRTISPDSPRKQKKDRRRIQLIQATMASIAERGLAETTVSHVSETAGMSRGIVNFYFESKETLMRETLAHLLEEQAACWRQALEKAEKTTPGERLEAVITALFSGKICTRKKLAVWAAFVAHAAAHAPYRFRIQQATEKLHAALSDILKPSSAFGPDTARRLLALVDGLWIAQMLGDSPRDRKEMVALCLSLCVPQPTASDAGKASPRRKPEDAPVVADLFAAL